MENSGKQNPKMGFKSPLAFKLLILNNLRLLRECRLQPHFFAVDDTRTAFQSLLHAVVGSSARQAHRLDIFSKSLGQIQNLDPDHLMSALKSRTAPGDTLPARLYSYRRLDPKDGCRW